ncbi:hypothetical protein CL634_09290 [bacterium]|nr:hypothetical protein [bacterium]
MQIIKAFQHLNPEFKLLGLSAQIQGSSDELYITEIFRMEIINSHEQYTILISNCTCKHFIFRLAKLEAGTKMCKHQDYLIALYHKGEITETFITKPCLISDADNDPNFDWRNY